MEHEEVIQGEAFAKKQMKMKFNVKAGSYRRFKSRFRELVANDYMEEAQLEILEQALPKSTKEKLSKVYKNTAQIWEQLDD